MHFALSILALRLSGSIPAGWPRFIKAARGRWPWASAVWGFEPKEANIAKSFRFTEWNGLVKLLNLPSRKKCYVKCIKPRRIGALLHFSGKIPTKKRVQLKPSKLLGNHFQVSKLGRSWKFSGKGSFSDGKTSPSPNSWLTNERLKATPI